MDKMLAVHFVHLVIAQLNIETPCAWRKPTLKTEPNTVPHLAYGTFDSVGKRMTHPTIIMMNIMYVFFFVNMKNML